MQFPAVNWHEGLFLQPHHFQAWDRHWSERISTGEQWQNPFSYGLLEISINSSALAAGFLQIDVLRCKTPGGMLVEFGAGQQSERRDLRPALDSTPLVDLYIGVPRLHLGSQNVDALEHRNGARFRAQWLELPDEIDAASVKPVEMRHLNAKLLLVTDDLSGFDSLRIGRVHRSQRDGVISELDADYIPPLLDCSAWMPFRSQLLSPLCDLMQQCSEQFAQQIADAGGTFDASTPLDVQRLLVLLSVNPAASLLRVVANSRGIHPLVAYLEVARLAGALDLLQLHRCAKHTSAYDHENIGPIFLELKRRIMQAVQGLQRAPYRQYCFVGNESGMHVAVERAHFESNRRWFIGIRKGELEVDSLRELLSPGNLDWKLGSLAQVERLFSQRAMGVELKPAASLPASLPKGEEWVYYEIVGTDRAAWKDVEATGTLALRIRDSMIVGREQLPNNRTLQVMSGRHAIGLQFSLFGVS